MKILVILASFNGIKYIEAQINSILSQEGVCVSLFIFDDCSSDGTFEFLTTKLSFNPNQVKIFRNKTPSGSPANNFLNSIKSISKDIVEEHDFFAFADQDDVWLSNKLYEAGLKLRDQTFNLYASNLFLWNQSSNSINILRKSFSQKKYDYLFEGGSAGCTYVFSKKLFYLTKDYIDSLDHTYWIFFSHDWFIYFIARVNNLKVFFDKRAFILYRIHDSNVHGQLNTLSFYALRERFKLISNGWFYHHAQGYSKLLSSNSTQSKIYRLYTKNYFTRLYVLLRYNFNLIRSKKKFIQFALISFLPRFNSHSF